MRNSIAREQNWFDQNWVSQDELTEQSQPRHVRGNGAIGELNLSFTEIRPPFDGRPAVCNFTRATSSKAPDDTLADDQSNPSIYVQFAVRKDISGNQKNKWPCIR